MTARTNLPLTALSETAAVASSTTAVDVTNGMNIVLTSSAIPARPGSWSLVIVFTNSFAGSKSLTVRAGANPPAFRKDLGDLVCANAGSSAVTYIGPLEPARFMQADGSINIDFTASTTGTVEALILPHLT